MADENAKLIARMDLDLKRPDPKLLSRMVEAYFDQTSYDARLRPLMRSFVYIGAQMALNGVLAAFEKLEPEQAEIQLTSMLNEVNDEIAEI